jgi:serine kinase of HPr protein (carbohydrate metabolism regulator)
MSALGEPISAGLVHGSAVYWPGLDKAALLLGASGSGKSDLALRLIDRGWQLIADDQVHLARVGIDVMATVPKALTDKIALPGLGICRQPTKEIGAIITHIVHLSATPPRFPLDRGRQSVCGNTLPVLAIDGLAASAPIRVERFLEGVML